jgi:phage-related protein
MKPIEFLGNSLQVISKFPKDARQATGYQLRRVQEGIPPADFKPMPEVGHGVEEIRIWVSSGTYRVIYIARLIEKVYVLHAFQKKTRKTPDSEMEIARKRFKQLIRGRQ